MTSELFTPKKLFTPPPTSFDIEVIEMEKVDKKSAKKSEVLEPKKVEKVEEPKVEEKKIEKVVEQPKVEAPKVEEKKVEKVVEQPKIEEKKSEEPAKDAGAVKEVETDYKSMFKHVTNKPNLNIDKEPLGMDSEKLSRFNNSVSASATKKAEEQSKKISELKEQLNSSTLNLVVPDNGVVNDYYSKIYEILAQAWTPPKYGTQSAVKVLVVIDNKGKFSYTIKQLSNDFRFNQELINFLDSMKSKPFPPYTDGSKTVIEIDFKTKE